MDEEIGVSPHGGADFRTIGDALAAATAIRAAGRSDVPHPAIAAQTDAHRIRISVGPGVYREKLRLSLPGIELVGAGRDETIIAWDDCASRVLPNGERMGTFNSYTVYVGAPDVTLRSLSVVNEAGDGRLVGQAVALYADADLLLVEDCRLSARQDTLCTGPLPKNPVPKGLNLLNPVAGLGDDEPRLPFRQLYRGCLIEGDVDFIFGSALAVFEGCEIRSLARPPLAPRAPGEAQESGARSQPPRAAAPVEQDSGAQGWIAAPSTYPDQAVGFVFLNCDLTAGPGAEDVYLGRPWRHTGRTAFLQCRMGAHIRPEGWDDWGKPEARAYGGLGEFASTGQGAPRNPSLTSDGTYISGRAPWARVFSRAEAEALSPQALFGKAFLERCCPKG